jgi:Domain of Unknown Function (DUF928)
MMQSGEFSVLIGINESEQLYRTHFTLPSTPGIISLRLPEQSEYALNIDQVYHWYVKLDCPESSVNLVVDGWITRIESTPERDRLIADATPDIWYDSLLQVSDRLRTNPQDTVAYEQWQSLLQVINAEEIGDQALLGLVEPIAE